MRFDDSLSTILSAETESRFGAGSAWRQIVDLMGRGRIPADDAGLERLRALRPAVPTEVRAASARALAFATPPSGLVGFFAEDELAIAAPVLRTAQLSAEDWTALLPALDPAGRSVLRHRRDLPEGAVRALESFGSVDFVLADDRPAPRPEPEVIAPLPPATEPSAPEWTAPLSETPFVALGEVARGLPLVAEALRRADTPPAPDAPAPRFEISDLVRRIDAFQRQREQGEPVRPAPSVPDQPGFRYETDAGGVIRWVDGVNRAALVGVAITHAAQQGPVQLDAVAPGAFRRRSSFADARLQVEGGSDAAGAWRLSGVPVFAPENGRFTGYRGVARRPRADETAEPSRGSRTAASESLRQLVHELRTPTNAIAGFAELIETELLGPVPPVYRDRAIQIRSQAGDLLAAIDDLDTAARVEGHTLELRSGTVPVAPLLERVLHDLAPLTHLRGATAIPPAGLGDIAFAGDDRAIERLIGRLLAALVSASGRGERLRIAVSTAVEGQVVLAMDRPAALTMDAGDELLFSMDAEAESEREGAPLLGTGFALRLARNLAAELGGSLVIDADRLTLRLPAAVVGPVEQATIS